MKKTKLIFLVAILIAIIFIIEIILLSILIPGNNTSNTGSLSANTNIDNNLVQNTQSSDAISLTLAEIAKHDSINDCWMAIDNKVYDVSAFEGSHPGGNTELLKGCGKDATTLYSSRGGKGFHSSTALSLLSSFYIGDLNQQVSVSAIENKTTELKNTTISNLEDDDEEDEDDEDEYEDDD